MKYSRKLILLFVVVFCSLTAEAREWDKINIPGATCGDGQPYSVFVDRKNSAKLVIEFMEGGACWNSKTCYGIIPFTSLSMIKHKPSSAILEGNTGKTWENHSAVYFPYCTGDVHSGNHVAEYRKNLFLHHKGYENILRGLEYLHQQNYIDFASMQDVLVWGSSAGAIGAFVHSLNVDKYLSPFARRTLIADSPGLHFGKNFWKKFSRDLGGDFQVHFSYVGLQVDMNDGFLVPAMGPVFNNLSHWNIGVLQSTRDTIMSTIFGDISAADHRALVLGPDGILATSMKHFNVQAWIFEGGTHVFLGDEKKSLSRGISNESAIDFAKRIYLETP